MDETITKRKARELLGVPTDYALSRALGVTHQAAYHWKEDEPLPKQRQWQIELMLIKGNEQPQT